jgi:carbamoyltransferase
MTKHVGLKPMDEEYIFMGMAAWGENKHFDRIYNDFIQNTREFTFKQNCHAGIDEDYLVGALDIDIAASVQAITEHLVTRLCNRARHSFYSKNLVLMGGVALNCVANSKIDGFDNIWIMPNPGDAGSSLGAAALSYGKKLNWQGPFLGYNISGEYPVNDIIDELLENKIVGVASGRAEFGPRALGNRSLLADPRGTNIKDQVNEIKRRQKFRPFAPMVLEEQAEEYFKLPKVWVHSPYMQSVGVCKFPDKFPAICHIDNTSRVQTVGKEPEFKHVRELLEKWFILTGCPILLNTSLNIRGEPMVNTRSDADQFEDQYGVRVLS